MTSPKTTSDKETNLPSIKFDELGLDQYVLEAVKEQGYEQPSPIQEKSIPHLLEGRDLLGQAQTGTGKTAAFALPLLSRIDPNNRATQLLILAPTRELAIQVAEACQQYAKHMKGVNVLPIYGGQSYTIQLKQLSRGAQIVVGTPGRVMDHMRKGTLKLKDLQALVLDEADEMLRMGFIDDVKWVLEQTPPTRQIALFSATMPREIKKVADKHLTDPVHIKIEGKSATGENIAQAYWIVKGVNKLDAITRILENEETDGVIVFVRTKHATVELSDKLAARGFRSEALNGDVVQATREKIIDRLKAGKLDILVATDVVARGLDVERISHVINYDVPHDTESYIHRIGRTGRAGRSGKAILFLSPREKRMLHMIERATKTKIDPIELPTIGDINKSRVTRFKDKIAETIQTQNLDFFSQIVTELQQEKELSTEQIAAALGHMAQGDVSILLNESKFKAPKERPSREDRFSDSARGNRRERRGERGERGERSRGPKPVPSTKATALNNFPDIKMVRYRLDVGQQQSVKPGNIVGAIANEADLESQYIGEIEIRENYSTVDLPDMPKEVLDILKKARVGGRPLSIRVYDGEMADAYKSGSKPKGSHPSGKKSYDSKKDGFDKGRKPKSDYAAKKRQERKDKN